jgi:hypothetical protein
MADTFPHRGLPRVSPEQLRGWERLSLRIPGGIQPGTRAAEALNKLLELQEPNRRPLVESPHHPHLRSPRRRGHPPFQRHLHPHFHLHR